MYVSILFLIFICLAFLAFFEDDEIRELPWLIVLLIAVLTLYVAFRPDDIDKDYISYLGFYENPSGIVAVLTEPTFKLINGVARLCGLPILIFVIYAFLAIPLKVCAIRRLSPYWYMSILLWYTHLFLIQEMTQIRVAVSTAFFLFSLPFLAKGCKLKFILFVVISVLFHYSALVLLPLIFIGNKPLSRPLRVILIVVPILAYTSSSVGIEILKMIPIPFIQTKLQMYEDLMVYKGGIWADINIYNAMAMIRLSAYYILIWKYDYLSDKYPYMPILLKIFCYSVCLYVGFSFMPPLAIRVEEYLSIIDCILLPLLAVLVRPHWLGRMLVVLYATCILLANLFLYDLLKI